MQNTSVLKFVVLSLFILSLVSCNKEQQSAPKTESDEIATVDSLSKETLPEVTVNDSMIKKIQDYIVKDYLTPSDLKTINDTERKFRLYQVDLNGDGKKETFVSFFTPYFCGTGGCSMVLLSDSLKPITKFTVTDMPIYKDRSMQNGWNVLYVKDGADWKELVFNN